jgi:hydroxyacylglutathione hydrolase
MLQVKKFTFNPFQENTFVVWDESLDCAIIDPGCYGSDEQNALTQFIDKNGLNPVLNLNTHAHIDHVMGNRFLLEKYGLEPQMHEADLRTLKAAAPYGVLIGLRMDDPPIPTQFIDVAKPIQFGQTTFSVYFTPGHAPGHVSFYHADSHSLFSGDVLFQGGIGRFDLPGGHYQTLMNSITEVLFALPPQTKVYCGHGPETSLGFEKERNPFVLEYLQA